MWIPTSFYERLPLFWLLAGLLSMAAAFYLGFEYKYSSWYFGVGALSSVWAVVVFLLRTRRDNAAASAESAEQTE